MDIQYLLFLQELRESTGDMFSPFLMTVSDLIISLVPVCILAFVYLCVDKKWGYIMMATIVSSTLINQLIKNVCCVYRPWIRDAAVMPYGDSMSSATGYSFPSGHTTTASSFFGSMAMWLRRYKWFVGLCLFLILLVSFSRNYLGVHTPQDVAVGTIEGGIILWIVLKLQAIKHGKHFDTILLIAGLLLIAAYLAFSTFKSYPLDYDSAGNLLVDPKKMISDCYATAGLAAGALSGWYIEHRWIKMDCTAKWYKNIWRLIVVVPLLLLHFKVLGSWLKTNIDYDWANFLICIGIVLIITLLVPLIDKIYKEYRK